MKAGDVALIRTHGVPKQFEQELRDRGVVLFDATCPVVKRNQRLAEERANAGDCVIIVGDKNHDEVQGVLSYAGEDAVVVSDEETLPIGDKSASILFQTTILPEKFEKIEKNTKNFEKNHNKSVGIFNTICYTTKVKQDEARAMAQKPTRFWCSEVTQAQTQDVCSRWQKRSIRIRISQLA